MFLASPVSYLWYGSLLYFFMVSLSMLAGKSAKFCSLSLHEVIILKAIPEGGKKNNEILNQGDAIHPSPSTLSFIFFFTFKIHTA